MQPPSRCTIKCTHLSTIDSLESSTFNSVSILLMHSPTRPLYVVNWNSEAVDMLQRVLLPATRYLPHCGRGTNKQLSHSSTHFCYIGEQKPYYHYNGNNGHRPSNSCAKATRLRCIEAITLD